MENERTGVMSQTTTPIENLPPEPKAEPKGPLPPELMDIGLNMDNMAILDHLGLKDEMFNDGTMDKVNEISDYIKATGKDIQTVDLELGNPHNMTRLDKIYSYVQLAKQEKDIKRKEFLITNEKLKYDSL